MKTVTATCIECDEDFRAEKDRPSAFCLLCVLEMDLPPDRRIRPRRKPMSGRVAA